FDRPCWRLPSASPGYATSKASTSTTRGWVATTPLSPRRQRSVHLPHHLHEPDSVGVGSGGPTAVLASMVAQRSGAGDYPTASAEKWSTSSHRPPITGSPQQIRRGARGPPRTETPLVAVFYFAVRVPRASAAGLEVAWPGCPGRRGGCRGVGGWSVDGWCGAGERVGMSDDLLDLSSDPGFISDPYA